MKLHATVLCAFAVLVAATGLREALGHSLQEESVPIVPAEVIARSLEAARVEARGGPLPAGYRMLKELSFRDGEMHPSPLALTPGIMSRLVRAGMRGLLRGVPASGAQGATAGTTELFIQASKDNTLYESVTGEVSNGLGIYVFSGRTGPMGGTAIRRAALAFDVAASIPGAATIVSASLDVYCSRSNGGSQAANLQRLVSDWGEGISNAGDPGGSGTTSETGDATWLHTFYPSSFWTSAGGDLAPLTTATTNINLVGCYTFTSAQLAADVLDMRDSPSANFGWVIRGNEAGSGTAKRFDSKDTNNPGTRPVLRVTVSGVDLTPPTVAWVAPTGGANLTPEVATLLQWTATDPSGVAFIDLLASYDGGATFLPIALGLAGTETTYSWFPPDRPGATILRIEATDGAMNTGTTDSNITLDSVMTSTLPTTLRDFDQPGTQPLEHGLDTQSPLNCAVCHGGYDDETEPYFLWSGSMMANAARDPLFEACLAIAEQDAEGSGDLCIRCHVPKGWMEGRSVPTDGSELLAGDRIGVSCDHCHRMVDPDYAPGISPAEDAAILADLVTGPPSDPGTGRYVVDPTGTRRGPFDDAVCDEVAHPFLTSPFHRDSKMCGTCHNVSNLAYEWNGFGSYVPSFDQPASDLGHGSVFPIERTFSEWAFSDYNSVEGVFAPALGGNRDYVSSCQDCHMRATTGSGCNPTAFPTAPVRNDLPLHDLTGGNTWVPSLIDQLYPGTVDPAALAATIDRARYMLQHASKLETFFEGGMLRVRVTNDTGHKLPTGYPEGRRMWINVQFLKRNGELLNESCAYDFNTGVLLEDAEAKIYEIKLGLDTAAAALTGLPAGPTFHFVLNNQIYKDNRIPPRGFTNLNFATFGGLPVGYAYANGQYWDDTIYTVPKDAQSAVIRLYYQTTSKEYVEFLRDENVTNSKGQELYDLWDQNGKCPPELMERSVIFFRDLEVEPLPGTPGPGRGIHR
ncbi:MAG: hypothetical protein CMJ89_16845 [Planctomycetes bacterium]|nr:hypothetical protein [Planctomycetota bacterium]